MSRGALMRLGLFQLGAGAVSVLLLGVLNRVLRVEMGADLLVVGAVLGGGHYLGALAAIPFGYFSDRRAVRGLHRLPYILAGISAVCLALALSPLVVRELVRDARGDVAALAFVFFLIEGIGTYVAGTAYLSLIADRTDEAARGKAVAAVWTLLMVGILVGVGYSVATLGEYSFDALQRSFLAAAVGVFMLAVVAVWRQERPAAERSASRAAPSLRESIRSLTRSRQTRLFFAFLVVGLFSMFMQDVLLEPFGGEVLGLSIRATSAFNAFLMVGTILGMWLGGARLIPHRGKVAVAAWGAWLQAGAFVVLAIGSAFHQAWITSPTILALGLGMGLFTVGGVSLMMDMTQVGQTGLFVGAWTLAQALARGPAAIAGTGLHNLARLTGAGPGAAYAAVFLVEAIGLALAVLLLREVGVARFRQETRMGSVIAQLVD